MKRYFCDRCRREILNQKKVYHIMVVDEDIIGKGNKRSKIPFEDIFCEDCVEEVEAFTIGTVPIQKTEQDKKRQKNIDMAKVETLLKAGWSIDEAAADVGASVDEVLNAEKAELLGLIIGLAGNRKGRPPYGKR